MEMILVLDTNVHSDWRRSGKWMTSIAFADRIIIPSVAMGEILHGFINGTQTEGNQRLFAEFLAEPQVEVAPVGRRTAEIYAEFVQYLRKQGTPIPTNDIWIAAQAHESGGELAARDGHFDALPMLRMARERR
jgi:tRNA(fMet)-specific endonuclease VapC